MTDLTTSPAQQGFDAFTFLARFAPLIFLLLLMLIFAIMEPRFLSSINLFNVMRQVSITGLLAIGMTFVILTAGIDLSIGSLLAFAGLVAAAVAKAACRTASPWVTIRLVMAGKLAALAASAWACWGAAARRRHHQAQGASLRGDAGRPCRSSVVLRFSLPRAGRSRASSRTHLGGRAASSRCRCRSSSSSWRPSSPISCCAIRAMAVASTRWAQILGRPAGRRQCQRGDRQRLYHHGFLRRPRRLRAGRAPQLGGSSGWHRLRAHRHRSVVIGGTSLFGGAGSIFGTVIGTILLASCSTVSC